MIVLKFIECREVVIEVRFRKEESLKICKLKVNNRLKIKRIEKNI